MPFDPNAYLAKKEIPQRGKVFDPDAYLASGAPQLGALPAPSPEYMENVNKGSRDLAKTGIQTAGTIGGEVLGAISPVPGGSVIGAGAGSAAGYELGERLLSGRVPTNKERLLAAAEGSGASVFGKGLGLLGKAAAKTKAGQYIIKKGGDLLAKGGEALSGIPAQDLKTYATRTGEVTDLYNKAGGDRAAAADIVRGNINQGVKRAKGLLNDQISESLSSPEINKIVDPNPILKTLSDAKSKLNKVTQKEAIAQIDEHINTIRQLTDENGLTTARDLYDIQKYLQESAKSVFSKQGAIFNAAPDASKAANAAYSQSRKLLSKEIPQISKANQELAKLHSIEKNLNRNVLKEGASEGALISAGSGTNPRQAGLIKQLGEMTNQDIVGQSQLLSAGDKLYNPNILPIDTTGKSLTRAALGYVVNPKLIPLSSPMVQKGLIHGTKAVAPMAGKIGTRGGSLLGIQALEDEMAKRR